MIKFSQKGDWSKTFNFFERAKETVNLGLLNRYGHKGVLALRAATPKDTGKTADSWYYEITHTNGGATLTFNNSNINNYVPIAIILQYGHATKNGGWVQGIDYINPALQPIFDELSNEVWKGVTKA